MKNGEVDGEKSLTRHQKNRFLDDFSGIGVEGLVRLME